MKKTIKTTKVVVAVIKKEDNSVYEGTYTLVGHLKSESEMLAGVNQKLPEGEAAGYISWYAYASNVYYMSDADFLARSVLCYEKDDSDTASDTDNDNDNE